MHIQKKVPCTKEDVFNSKQIKVIEKRKLMKFLTFVMNYQSEPEAYAGIIINNYFLYK